MGRVAIVGTPGAGKSTLARELGARAGLPVIHLDQHHFLPGWQRKSDEEWDRIAAELLAGERWVMDGAFAMEEAVARADTIVFLDLSRARGYLGSVKRLALAYLGRPAPDFAPGCEDKLDRDFLAAAQDDPSLSEGSAAGHRGGSRAAPTGRQAGHRRAQPPGDRRGAQRHQAELFPQGKFRVKYMTTYVAIFRPLLVRRARTRNDC